MRLEPFFVADVAERVLHGDGIGTHHAVRIDVYDIHMVKGLDEIGARDDLSRPVERNLREFEVVNIALVFFSENECAS